MNRDSTFNDGVLNIYQSLQEKNNFGARINSRNLKDFQLVGKSFYKEETRRIQDFQFAEGLNHQLTLKLKIPFRKNLKANYKIEVDNYLYDLIHFDPDNEKKSIYLYLEGVGPLE